MYRKQLFRQLVHRIVLTQDFTHNFIRNSSGAIYTGTHQELFTFWGLECTHKCHHIDLYKLWIQRLKLCVLYCKGNKQIDSNLQPRLLSSLYLRLALFVRETVESGELSRIQVFTLADLIFACQFTNILQTVLSEVYIFGVIHALGSK